MTEQLAVLGRPIAHSRSPEIHQLFAAQAGMDIAYDRLLVPEGKFRETALGFLETGKGCNITLPCKHDAFLLADELSPGAEQAQAVNTLSKTPGGQLRGDNTDGPGLVNDLVRNLGWEIAGRRVLVLGAGGAVSGVLPDLIAAGPTVLHVSNRTHEKAVALVTRQREPLAQAVALNDLNETYDLIINGT
ncbi:MAG: shikimate dehydrogenase, partial [Pseudomonadales bacterium]